MRVYHLVQSIDLNSLHERILYYNGFLRNTYLFYLFSFNVHACVCVVCIYMSMQCPWRLEESIASLKARVIGTCESLNGSGG